MGGVCRCKICKNKITIKQGPNFSDKLQTFLLLKNRAPSHHPFYDTNLTCSGILLYTVLEGGAYGRGLDIYALVGKEDEKF